MIETGAPEARHWQNYLAAFRPVLDLERLKEERILVTGGSGFIGTNIVEFYRNWIAGALINFDIVPPRNPEHASLWRKVDICDRVDLARAIAEFRPTAVFHMAARADLIGRTADDYPENSEGVRNLMRALRELPHRPKIIVASSRLVCNLHHIPVSDTDYSAPNAYGLSKVQTEIVTRQEGGNSIPWILVRPTGIWGPWFGVPYRNFFEMIRRGLYLHPRGHATLKSYGFVGNTVFELDRLMYGAGKRINETSYVCDPVVDVYDWARMIAKQLNVRAPFQVPYSLLYLAAKAGDLLEKLGMRHAPLTSFRLDNLTTNMVVDFMLAAPATGPLPFSLGDATAITCSWLDTGDAESRR